MAATNPVGWFEIHVENMDRARRFYEQVFEVELSRLSGVDEEMWAFPSQAQGQGAAGALLRMPGVPSGGNSVLVYFTCQDCAVTAGRAAEAAGRIEKQKFAIGPYGFIALVVDTEGNMIGLHSMA